MDCEVEAFDVSTFGNAPNWIWICNTHGVQMDGFPNWWSAQSAGRRHDRDPDE